MRVAFMIPPGDGSLSPLPAVATVEGRVLIATTEDEVRQVPSSWERLDLDDNGAISVSDWLADLRGERS